jgi:hypothetical protein
LKRAERDEGNRGATTKKRPLRIFSDPKTFLEILAILYPIHASAIIV